MFSTSVQDINVKNEHYSYLKNSELMHLFDIGSQFVSETKPDSEINESILESIELSKNQSYSPERLNGDSPLRNMTEEPFATVGNDFIIDKEELDTQDIEILETLIVKCKRDWKKISLQFKRLTKRLYDAEDLRIRYNSIIPQKRRGGKFSSDEDLELLKSIDEFGFDWIKISKRFPERTPLSLRNRFYAIKRGHRGAVGVNLSKIKTEKAKVNKRKRNINNSAGKRKILQMKIDEIVLDHYPEWMKLIDSMKY